MELHEVVSPFTRLSFHFSSPIFRNGVVWRVWGRDYEEPGSGRDTCTSRNVDVIQHTAVMTTPRYRNVVSCPHVGGSGHETNVSTGTGSRHSAL